MSKKVFQPSLGPATFQVLDEFDGDLCKEEVLVRLIHFWEARNFKKGNMLMGLELLLIDAKSIVVQGFIPANRLFRYQDQLKCNFVYKLKDFMVTPCKKNYKVSSHSKSICFIEKTSLVPSQLGDHTIAQEKFRFRTFEEFTSIVDRNIDLFDVIGQLRLISGDNIHSPTTMEAAPPVEGNRSNDRVFLHLLMKEGQTIRIYLWGSIAAMFRERWNVSEVKPVVVLITTVNAKSVGSVMALSSTSGTRLFFDRDVDETKQFLTWLGDSTQNIPTIASSSSGVTKLELVTISEILQFLQNENPQEASFYCFATVVDILSQYGWYYISCGSCNTKLEKTETSMYCNTCKKFNNVGLIRYRFEITVSDKNNSIATFVIFDGEGIKIAGRRAADVLNDLIQSGHDSAEDIKTTTPECLKHIIGSTCKFQIKLTNYNFKTTRQTISVSRIIERNVAHPSRLIEPSMSKGDGVCETAAVSPISEGSPESAIGALEGGEKKHGDCDFDAVSKQGSGTLDELRKDKRARVHT